MRIETAPFPPFCGNLHLGMCNVANVEARGAKILWRDHYWKEFNGYNHAFCDPWGNEIVLWRKVGENPEVPANYTRE